MYNGYREDYKRRERRQPDGTIVFDLKHDVPREIGITHGDAWWSRIFGDEDYPQIIEVLRETIDDEKQEEEIVSVCIIANVLPEKIGYFSHHLTMWPDIGSFYYIDVGKENKSKSLVWTR